MSQTHRGHKGLQLRADNNGILQADVMAMLKERQHDIRTDKDYGDLAHDLIVVIRERVLQEIGSYTRRSVR